MSEAVAIERSIWINAPREKVWRAVTDPARLMQWYAVGCAWEIPALQVGAVVRFHNTPDDILPATIAVLDAPREFTLRWLLENQPAGAYLLTSFLLDEAGGGTTVTILESGFDTIEQTEDCEGGMGIEDIENGYAASLENLKSLLESSG